MALEKSFGPARAAQIIWKPLNTIDVEGAQYREECRQPQRDDRTSAHIGQAQETGLEGHSGYSELGAWESQV